jgi:hypothetical protein
MTVLGFISVKNIGAGLRINCHWIKTPTLVPKKIRQIRSFTKFQIDFHALHFFITNWSNV